MAKDADIIDCRTQSLSFKQRHLKYAQLSSTSSESTLPCTATNFHAFQRGFHQSGTRSDIQEAIFAHVFTCPTSFLLHFTLSLPRRCHYHYRSSIQTLLRHVLLVTTFLISESCSRLGDKATMKIDPIWSQ